MFNEFWKWLTTAGRPDLEDWRKPKPAQEGSTTQQLLSMGERLRDPDLLYSAPVQQRLYSPMYGDLSGSTNVTAQDTQSDYGSLADRWRQARGDGGY